MTNNEFIADFHIHSSHSRATSKAISLDTIDDACKNKGIDIVATGDITHPAVIEECDEKLKQNDNGLYFLKDKYIINKDCPSINFMLSGEISTIYKDGDKTRKIHHVVVLKNLDAAKRFSKALGNIGNITSDGRPILGITSKNLLEMLLEADSENILIPAHIWTPWFAVLGSKSGYDSIEECYKDLTPYIYALETGLSSNPPMNWQVSSLDKFSLVSNSDAHSLGKLGREATLFRGEKSYANMLSALKKENDNLKGTIEFFPEEGKYFGDGHRACDYLSENAEMTKATNGICPICKKPLTLGVNYRVAEIADRKPGETHPGAKKYEVIVPLKELLGLIYNVGSASKKVETEYRKMIDKLGTEFYILRKVSLKDIEKVSGRPILAEVIRDMREEKLNFIPGYDGEFGVLSVKNISRSLFDDIVIG